MKPVESVSYLEKYVRPAPAWVWLATVFLVGVFGLAAVAVTVIFGLPAFL